MIAIPAYTGVVHMGTMRSLLNDTIELVKRDTKLHWMLGSLLTKRSVVAVAPADTATVGPTTRKGVDINFPLQRWADFTYFSGNFLDALGRFYTQHGP